MTETKIEKKKAVWPWIIGGILLALLVYFIGFTYQKETVPEDLVAIDIQNVKENNVIVSAFIRFMEVDTMKMELDHTFTKEALLKLVDATNAMADEIQFDIGDNMARAIKYVNRTIADPIETSNAKEFKEAADILTSTILKSMQEAKYPGLTNEVVQIQNAVASINPDVLILDQKDAIKTFFIKVTDLLRMMN